MERQKFFYKLCLVHKERIFCYANQSIEFQIGQVITQDISSPTGCYLVYKTPEQAFSSELGNKTFDPKTKNIHKKTIIKLMCWGLHLEDQHRFAFTNMCIVENVGMPKIEKPTFKENSFLRGKVKRVEKSPLEIRSQRYSPSRFCVERSGSPRHRKELSLPRVRVDVGEILRRVKEKSQRINKEIESIERLNQVCELEDLESIRSSEG